MLFLFELLFFVNMCIIEEWGGVSLEIVVVYVFWLNVGVMLLVFLIKICNEIVLLCGGIFLLKVVKIRLKLLGVFLWFKGFISLIMYLFKVFCECFIWKLLFLFFDVIWILLILLLFVLFWLEIWIMVKWIFVFFLVIFLSCDLILIFGENLFIGCNVMVILWFLVEVGFEGYKVWFFVIMSNLYFFFFLLVNDCVIVIILDMGFIVKKEDFMLKKK